MRTVVLAAAGALLLVGAGPAAAELPPGAKGEEIGSAQRQASVADLDRRVSSLDLEGSVSELESESTDGDEQVLSLRSDILFAFGKADLTPTATKAIGDLVDEVPDGATIEVEGHTDSIGGDADNRELSKRRAQAVADAIAKERSDLSSTVTGKGESEPVEPNTVGGEDNPEGRALNRRVEVRWER